MVHSISIEQFLILREHIPIIDVRTENEYQQGHIPSAYNFPIFNHEERAQVGTMYKQKGREPAILLGFDIVGSKWRTFIEDALSISPDKKVIVHCWRGGMRSGAMAWALDFYGFETYVLEGGYKTFRHWSLSSFGKPLIIRLIGGMTGSQKTEMLHELQHQGEQIIDLEKVANHEGSAFGSRGYKIQPTQEQFENDLALHVFSLQSERITWVEDESRAIGKRILPEELWKQMQSANLIEVQMDFQRRFEFVFQKYGRLENSFLKEATSHISKRLGPVKTKEAITAIEENRMEDFIRIAIEYYDKTYRKCLENKSLNTLFPLEIHHESIEECVKKVLQINV